MSKETNIRDALKNLEDIALAYTVKTSQADSPNQFVEDYVKNIKCFEEIKNQQSTKWLY